MSLITRLFNWDAAPTVPGKARDAVSYEMLVIAAAVEIYSGNASTMTYAQAWQRAQELIDAMPTEFKRGVIFP